jgi:hypothetical protein
LVAAADENEAADVPDERCIEGRSWFDARRTSYLKLTSQRDWVSFGLDGRPIVGEKLERDLVGSVCLIPGNGDQCRNRHVHWAIGCEQDRPAAAHYVELAVDSLCVIAEQQRDVFH